MRITKAELNDYNRMFAHFGGKITSLDEKAGIAVIEFGELSKLDVFVKRIKTDPTVSDIANYDVAMLDGRAILTITSKLESI